MQSVNDAQYLNITPLFLSSNRLATSSFPALVIVIVPLKSIYALILSHKLDLNIEVLNIIGLLVLYVPHESSFISTQVFALNLVG